MLLACDSPTPTRAAAEIPDETWTLEVIADGAGAPLVIQSRVRAVDHPPTTFGWDNTEVGPMPRLAAEAWTEVWTEVRALPTGRVPTLADRAIPEGYVLLFGGKAADIAEGRRDALGVQLTHCWSPDRRRLAVHAANPESTSQAWVVFDYASELRIGQFMQGDSRPCGDAVLSEPLAWHPTLPPLR